MHKRNVQSWCPCKTCATWSRPHISPAVSPCRSTTISELQFHKAADFTLDDLTERIEALVDDLDLDDSDVEHSQGVLTLKLGKLGTYVINKQTPNRQLWMSSPVRYDRLRGWCVFVDIFFVNRLRLASFNGCCSMVVCFI